MTQIYPNASPEEYLEKFIGIWKFELLTQSNESATGKREFIQLNSTCLKFKEEFDKSNLVGEGFFGYNKDKEAFYELGIFNISTLNDILIGKSNPESNRIDFKLIDPYDISNEIKIKANLTLNPDNFIWENYKLVNNEWKLNFKANFSRIN